MPSLTAEQMHRNVQLRLQKINSYAFDNILAEEIDIYLNLATMRIIKGRMEPLSNIFQKGFEESQKRIDDLRELVVKDSSLDTTEKTGNVGIDGYFVDNADFPSNYMYLLGVRFLIQYSRQGVTYTTSASKRVIDGVEDTDYKEKLVLGKYTQQDDVYRLLIDPFNKSKALEPIYCINENGINVYTDDKFIVDKIVIDYIREPATIVVDEDTPDNSVDSDLSGQLHDEIVDTAVKLILIDIDQLGPEQKLQNLSKTE